MEFVRCCVRKMSLSTSSLVTKAVEEALLDRLRSEVPLIIVVANVWFMEASISFAASRSEGIMLGPGRR